MTRGSYDNTLVDGGSMLRATRLSAEPLTASEQLAVAQQPCCSSLPSWPLPTAARTTRSPHAPTVAWSGFTITTSLHVSWMPHLVCEEYGKERR